jgi:hypothetical protein
VARGGPDVDAGRVGVALDLRQLVVGEVEPVERGDVLLQLLGARKMLFCRDLTGATGLEPATSGVTGRYWLDRQSRLPPGITG